MITTTKQNDYQEAPGAEQIQPSSGSRGKQQNRTIAQRLGSVLDDVAGSIIKKSKRELIKRF